MQRHHGKLSLFELHASRDDNESRPLRSQQAAVIDNGLKVEPLLRIVSVNSRSGYPLEAIQP